MFTKIGELLDIAPSNIQSPETVIPVISSEVMEEMKKYAVNLKRIAPKADDFLYFSCVMMHAAEAALINDDGTPKLTRKGEPLKAGWNKKGGTWRWESNDPSLKPYKNSNGDIFPESELILAHKKWIGRPLCIDHKSSSVDHTRGFIVDTYYDRALKRVIALCALDKKNYPDLARKVETGYSNAVSMGTAVAQAICYDCGTVARTEHDFCQHMRSKSCYGEINIGLSPMELSIVVNGADPQAKIKHIIAMANTLNSYVEEKEQELKKLSDQTFSATLSFGENDATKGLDTNLNLRAADLEGLRHSINDALDKYQHLHSTSEESAMPTNDTAFNQSSGTIAMDQTELPGTDQSLAPPHARFAANDDLQGELGKVMASIESKLAQLQTGFDKLASVYDTKEEPMTGNKEQLNKAGYFQGGGGLNEPEPGKQKYPVDPMNEDLRNNDDKQMVGQKPFPDVGPVDGMYPGYDSFPTGELERKKMLARAESEERALRRNAVIQKAKDALDTAKKEAYFQGGGGVNEPAPHKVKYPIDPMQDDLRDNDDKQMVGQSPFPDVGAVDGMHPSPVSADPKDELKRKQLLQRASLRARFIKAANADGSQDVANSAWEVFRGDELLLTKTVDEITGGRADALYNTVATETFGKDLIGKVKALGATKVDALFKKAQMPAPAPMGDAPQTPAMPGGDMSAPGAAEGKEGDPKETAQELAEKIRDLASDLVEAQRALTGDQAEMGEEIASPMGAPADDSSESKVSTAMLNEMRQKLAGTLQDALKEAVAGLNDHEQEMNIIVSLFDRGIVTDTNRAYVGELVNEALTEAKEALADSFHLLGAFVKYAKGTDLLEKRAAEEAELAKQAEGDAMELGNKEIMDMLGESGAELKELAMAMDNNNAPMMGHDSSCAAEDADPMAAMLAEDLANLELGADDANQAVMVSTPAEAAAVTKENPGASVEVKKASLETKDDRDQLRTKLAEGLKWNPIFYDFHPKGKALPGPLDTKPSDNLEVVENLEEKHDRMMEVATMPPKIRQAAAEIQKLVAEGKLDPSEMDLLVANGVDPEAVKYWKEFYGEIGPEGKEFATELVKEHAKAQAEADMATYRVKIARAYELANDMMDRDLLSKDPGAREAQVNEIMKWNDEGFESMKKVVARHTPSIQKAAGRMPQVGVYGTEEVVSQSGSIDLRSRLENMFASSKSNRMF